jgi:hypothetical protein
MLDMAKNMDIIVVGTHELRDRPADGGGVGVNNLEYKRGVREMKVTGAIFIACQIFLASCTPGMFELLDRTMDDPALHKPFVESFTESNTITVSWERDAATDEYILERAEDEKVRSFFEIYRGGMTEYVDRGLPDNKRYVYRLYKRRGKKTFGPTEQALGVSSLVCRDIYEPNDAMERAIQLETIDYIANMYYYRAYSGEEAIDEDWYFIRIPPLRQASVVVNDSRVEESNRPTHFEYYEYKRDQKPVRQLLNFWIVNNEMVTKDYYFKLYPAKNQYIGAELPAGGAIIQYKISIREIVPIITGG